MASFDQVNSLLTQKLLNEGPAGRTELVSDASGNRFARKYLKAPSEGKHPYERLAGLSCPQLPDIGSTMRVGDTLVVLERWVEGSTLEELVERGNLSRRDALVAFDDVCAAVEQLHSVPGAPIIHRDVNPSNVVFDGERACLINLGIARSYRQGARADTQLWGTAGYAAPEQFGFGQSDERSDVYALGMLLRFLETGCHPDEDPASPLPARIGRVVARTTSLDPKDRYPSAAALRRAAHAACRGRSAPAPAPVHPESPASGPGASAPALQAREEGTLSERLVGATARSRGLQVLWGVWCVCVWVFVAGMSLACFASIAQAGVFSVLSFRSFVVIAGFFWAPALLYADFAGLTRRLPWLRTRRYRGLALTLAAVLVAASAALYVSGVVSGPVP